MIQEFIALFDNEVLFTALNYFSKAWPIWVPIILIDLAWHLWLSYVRRAWINKQGSIFLEVKIPRNQPKSPAAMEFVLQGIWENANITTPADAFWEGKTREWFSLEIVSIGGEVRFFIWAFPRWKRIIESRIYAQYPGAEVVEVKDYALDLHYVYEQNNIWGITTALVKPDAYPIKTYIEYELDKKKGDEQEEIVDPITPVIEYLGTMKPNEVAGIQIMLRAHASESYLYGRLSKKEDWQKGVKEEIKKMIEGETFIKSDGDRPASMLNLSKAQIDTVAAIQRNAGKLAFDTMIRCIYVAPQDIFDRTRGMGIIGSMRQFGSSNLNGIKPLWFSGLTHSWQDFNDVRKRYRLSTLINAYKRRSFFEDPYKHLNGKPYVLSTEEVATIFHFPGAVATTPTLMRAPTKKAEAPANLPI